jgi:hypothetical protein
MAFPKNIDELTEQELNSAQVVQAPAEFGGQYWLVSLFNSQPWLRLASLPALPKRELEFRSVYGPKALYESYYNVPGGVVFWPRYNSVYNQEQDNFIAKVVPPGVDKEFFDLISTYFFSWNMKFMRCYSSFLYSGLICIFNGAIDPQVFELGERVTQSAKNVFSTEEGPRNNIVTNYQLQLINNGIVPDKMHAGTLASPRAVITPDHIPERDILDPLIETLSDEIKNGTQF